MNDLVIMSDFGVTCLKGVPVVSSRSVAEILDIELSNDMLLYKNTHVDAIGLLETAMLLSLRDPDLLDRNLKIIDLATEIFDKKHETPFLLYSIRETVMRNFLNSRIKEVDVCGWFKENFRNVLGTDFEIVKRKNDKKHIPDFWLLKNGYYTPVEVKLHSFKDTDLKQLLRYMDFYDCSEGVAVAKNLKCSLPSNITFVSYEIS